MEFIAASWTSKSGPILNTGVTDDVDEILRMSASDMAFSAFVIQAIRTIVTPDLDHANGDDSDDSLVTSDLGFSL